jgi:asparagine synthase (glutamine-hydrolysing)
MGMWYVCRNDSRAEARLAQARAQFARHGHPAPREVSTPHFHGLAAGHIYPSKATFLGLDDGFIAVAGTLFYRGETGEPALRLLLQDYEPPFDRWSDVLGQFAALIFKRGRLFVLTDWSASFHVYQSEDRSVVSTSFLSTAQSLDRVRFNPQAVYEFVFHGTPLGNDSVFLEISRPDRTQELELGAEVRVHTSPRVLPVAETDESIDAVIDRILAASRRVFGAPVRHHRDNIQCPLSGGFDSRLVLSLLMDHGVRPLVYVYGSPQDADVQVARDIAAREGFGIEVFDKSASRGLAPDEFAQIVEQNFHEMDGTPMTGGMFDAGGNSQARHDRAKGGALAVSGAAGEIFRNYFYLADRPLRTRAVIDAFYSGFNPADCTSALDARAFLRRMDEKLQAALGVGGEKQGRLEIERAYPLFRCPAAFGREASMVGRFGPYFMPFCEYALTREAANIPLKWRTHGVFQSRLLARVNPRLAGYQSAYGHSFTEPPSVRHRVSDAVSLYRPAWLRRYSYRMKHAFARNSRPRAGLLSPAYLGRVIDMSFPAMSRFFDMRRLSHSSHFKSAATLEYLARHLGSRVKE